MAWFSIKGKTTGHEGLDQFLGLITAKDAVHAREKSRGLFPRRQITFVQEVEVSVKRKGRGRRYA